jgi:hypothetical protein
MAVGGKWLYNTDMHPTKRRAKKYLDFSVTLFLVDLINKNHFDQVFPSVHSLWSR